MTTMTDHLPMRPRGAARHAANATAALGTDASGASDVSDASEATGAAVHTLAVPVSTAAQTAPALPSRRELRPATRTTGPGDLARAVTQAVTVPLRTLGSAVASAKAVPVTATAVVACLFVSVATPQTAMASTPQGMLPALDAQEYTASADTSITVERDAFAIGTIPVRTAPAADAAAASTSPGSSSVRPVAGSIPAAGGFGSRWVQGCAACSTNHQGLDFAAPTGTAVVAAMSGRVVSAGAFGGYGNQVLLQHADGSQTRYGHLSQIGVRVGQAVAAGQRIGAVGNTGVSTGSHLHFEVIIGGAPVNPAAWLQNRGLL
ncbi:Membrane proteins related to metalloendopeptidases [Curtobacterium sp. 314Chir4.1]|uniref:M23 family metallopeptidase n=1 Tax=Curtobacterium sp. 314Chir4.1 TaxID=1279028 RepID=UPI000BD310E4|nr:M23 family metallopeptidase [Curtobacterium sp. 314Chir4.1]SOC88764.1 Membrane proteins related to metalloendopeptidases [Curtobacterium sp. 314Chir4.1]